MEVEVPVLGRPKKFFVRFDRLVSDNSFETNTHRLRIMGRLAHAESGCLGLEPPPPAVAHKFSWSRGILSSRRTSIHRGKTKKTHSSAYCEFNWTQLFQDICIAFRIVNLLKDPKTMNSSL